MLVHPQIDPIIFSVGPVAVRWYGLMYVIAFVAFVTLAKVRIRRGLVPTLVESDIDDLLLYGVLGVIVGGRLGQVLFYEPGYYFENPIEIVKVWKGGLSFHGGFLGVLTAVWIFCHRRGKRWLAVMDAVAPAVPPGIAAGRLGNFINQELPGRVTDVPWGMWFPAIDPGGPVARHPSQLYQVGLEGLALFFILWWFASKPRPVGAISGVFLVGYGVFRSVAEFVRQPEASVQGVFLGVTLGQWLSLPMVLVGIAMIAWAYKKQPLSS
ncbi:prolipoprotein diacylglyceryl transferase [Usitatibacter palustris]|uniref:Phosphatidylglycerol--prolipoprotein diacylglyceryl transferase n=1 Tax=Usitatibacter palustris TaxID=2732487 RepID=A0A6M4H4K9_9PROT|nr:prolipoprotein diacylglyceryl transferase [Usitatibacter palustris]QJR13444.1 Phosphatidylglycerol--prolipoprotein diacylglyceryl transferase [Usitatibacter palustris]